MLQPSSISLLAGFEFPTRVLTCVLSEWAGPISSGGSVPASLGFLCFVFTSNTLVLAVKRGKKKLFIFDATEATCSNPFSGERPILEAKHKSTFSPPTQKRSGFNNDMCRLLVVGFVSLLSRRRS